ncbi:MAG: hypothetical protein KDA29_12685 [Phycisphaerales bacterium]|nr:hypothetical protein [Phycisphaerales bacterium]
MSTDKDQFNISIVGHCTPDSFALRSAIAGFLPNARTEVINDESELTRRLGEFDLHLLNRVMEGRFHTESALEFIETHHEHHKGLMLISNFPESREQSVKVGGAPGFGKRSMRSDEARDALYSALGINQTTN